jgi:aldehyde dehydrogenase (NAD+)
VLKPSELAPHTAHLLAEVLHEAGLPAGVFNLVHGRAAGEHLVSADGLSGVSFTGSNPTGKAIARTCVERGVKYQLEMGGKNPLSFLKTPTWPRPSS